MRLRALLAFEAAALRRDVLSKAFDASSRQFLEELHLALPDVQSRICAGVFISCLAP